MSIKWTSYVWETAVGVEGSHLLVLLSIADHAGDDGTAFPSVTRLASRARCDERTVQRALAALESEGWLERQMRPGHSTLYRLLTPDTGVTPDKMSPPSPVSPHPRHPRHPSGDTGVTHNRKRTTNEPAGAGGDLTSEPAPEPSGTEQQQPVSHDATDRVTPPFPRWAIAKLGRAGEAQAQAWQQAWATITSMVDPHWDPNLHLTKYLAQCEEKRRTPTPSDWTKWYAEDEQRAAKDKAAAAAVDRSSTNPYWE